MPKKYEINETPFGICSDPNVLKAPQGALLQADNCIIRRNGIIEPRDGLQTVSTSGIGLTYISRMFNFDGDLLLYDKQDTEYFEFLGNLGNELQDEDSGHPAFFANYYNALEFRGNLYVCCQDGIRKVTGSSSTDLFKAGLINNVSVYSLTPTGITAYNWWEDTKYIAYRTTLKKTDANEVLVESIPSFAKADDNTAGVTRVPRLLIYIGEEVAAGDIVRIFRTKQATTLETVGDTYYLAGEHTVTSAEVSAGTITYDDKVPDAELRETLYTNSENEGIEQSNDRPPVAKCIAEYKNSIFYSNVIEPSRLLFSMRSSLSDLVGVADGAGFRGTTGTASSGSADITSVGDTTGVQVGQHISGNAYIPNGTYIAAISGSTITMTQNATGSGAINLYILDTVTFGFGSTYETYTFGVEGSGNDDHIYQYFDRNIKNGSAHYTAIAGELVYLGDNVWTSVAIERIALNSSTFYMWGTHGAVSDDSYDIVLSPPTWSGSAFVFNTSNGVESDMLVKPNRTYYSKTDQPEHVPGENHRDIGDSSAIVQTVETKDGLLFFKDDGLYVLTGEGPLSGWTTRLLDRDCKLLNSNSAKNIDGSVYAITTDGLVRATVYGVEKITLPYIHDELYYSLQHIYSRRVNDNLERLAWIEYDKRKKNIVFAADYSETLGTTELYVYNTVTGALATWSFADDVYCIIANVSDYNYLYCAGAVISGGDPGLWEFSETYPAAENRRSLVIDSKPDSTTINFTTAHEASVGDWIFESGGASGQIILTVVDSDTVTVADNSDLSGTVYVCVPVTSTIRWAPKFGETRTLRKDFKACSFSFGTLGVNADESLNAYEVSFITGGANDGPHAVDDKTVRCLVPVDHAREFFLEPALIVKRPWTFWNLVGMSLEFYMQRPRGV